MEQDYNPHVIEKKWQSRWNESRVFEPEPDNREKFFITIPYPYLNGNLHAGHTRTFTIGDVGEEMIPDLVLERVALVDVLK